MIPWNFFLNGLDHIKNPLIFKMICGCFSRFKILMQLAPVPKASIDFLAGIGAGFAEAGVATLVNDIWCE